MCISCLQPELAALTWYMFILCKFDGFLLMAALLVWLRRITSIVHFVGLWRDVVKGDSV